MSGLSTGTLYSFRYRVKNVQGWSPFSTELSAVAANPPSQPASVTTTNDGSSVKISWSAPYHGGDSITAFTVLISQSDGIIFTADSTNCDGGSTSVLSNLYCLVPMTTLKASPYFLAEGSTVIATVKATNRAGDSATSSPNSVGAYIQGLPSAPPTAPSRGSQTDTD